MKGKKKKRSRCGRKDEKLEKKKKRMERFCAEGREEEEGQIKKKTKDVKEGEGEGRKEKRRGEKREKEKEKRGGGRRIKNRENSARDAPPSPDAFPSRKLGNNITPIKGRLGKNTTPTGRDLEKLIQKLQRNPGRDSRASNIHPRQTSFTHHEGQSLQSVGYRSYKITIYKKAKALGNSRNHSKFSINPH